MKAKATEQDALVERTRANEAFFESCIDIIPARIYLNPDDRINWYKLISSSSRTNKASSVDDETENGAAEDDEVDEEDEGQDLDFVVKHSRFDPRFCKSVSQIYKDLSQVKEKPTKFKFEAHKKASLDANKSIKIDNKKDAKSKSPGGSNKNSEKKAEKRKLKKEKQSKNKENKNKKIKLEKNLAQKESASENGENNVASKQKKPILNSNGDVVYSKFDFSVDKKSSQGGKKSKSKNLAVNAKPKDYKTLVKQLQEKKEKIQQLKETEPEKALQMETEDKWKSLIHRASGAKVKDDVDLLKKSIKRIEKKKDKSKKVWKERVAGVEKAKNSAQEKRQKNIEARKTKNKEKKIKGLKKRGRILPGF